METSKTRINFLAKLCSTHIKYSFYSGLLDNVTIVADKVTGYFNAVKLCEQSGQEYKKWVRLDRSETMLKYYTGSSDHYKVYDVKFSQKTEDQDKLYSQITGTYIPSELILDLASWISTKLYDDCIKFFIDNMDHSIEHRQLVCKLEEVERQMDQLTIVVDQKEKYIDELEEVVNNNQKPTVDNQKTITRQTIQDDINSLATKRDRLVIVKRKTYPTAIITMLSELSIIILD